MAESKFSDRQEQYNQAEQCDKSLFAEQRSNILLIAGDHYAKLSASVSEAIRGRADISSDQKIRITKNHTQKIHKLYVNSIVSSAPGVKCIPDDEKDPHDKKAADLRNKFLKYGKKKYGFAEKNRDYADDYCGVGEVFVKVFFDPSIGDLVGFEQEMGEDGTPQVDEMGQPKASKRASFSGDFVFERIYGFNLLRCPSAQSLDESPYLIVRKMVDTKVLKLKYKDDEDKLKFIQEDEKKTYNIFDGQRGTYGKSKGQTLIKETYYRPSLEYPMGYYYIDTESGPLEEGELPLGIFPIFGCAYEKIQTSPRGRSPIKHGRPYQAEINRCASKIAEHQTTLGDDKIITRNGSKLESSVLMPGIRQGSVSGEAPVVIQGRDGGQFLPYLQQQIEEFYNVMGVQEILAEKGGNVDPYALIFQSASQKKMFASPIQRFERFQVALYSAWLEMAPHYYSQETLAKIVGPSDVANIPEIMVNEKMGFQVTVEPASEDIDTLMGRQMVLSQALQYGATQLGPEGVAAILSEMPFAGITKAFSDKTMNKDLADNKILALNRGEQPQVGPYEPHVYLMQRLTAEMNAPAFKTLSPQIQQNYGMVMQQHQQAEAQVQAQIQALKNEYIPTDGPMVGVDMYVENTDPTKAPIRWRAPQSSLNWLKSTIDKQNSGLMGLGQLPSGVQASIMGQGAQMAGGGQMPAAQGGMPQGAQQIPG